MLGSIVYHTIPTKYLPNVNSIEVDGVASGIWHCIWQCLLLYSFNFHLNVGCQNRIRHLDSNTRRKESVVRYERISVYG